MSNPNGGKVGRPLNRQPGRGVFGSKLRQSRMQAGLTMQAVGELLGKRGDYSEAFISKLELGQRIPKPEVVEKLAQIFDWDDLPAPVVPPRKEAPVAVTHGLRSVLRLKDPVPLTKKEAAGIDSVISDDDEFSLRRLRKSAQYVVDNIQKLVEQYESTLREMHRLEQRMTGGLSVEQIETLRDKARRWDDLQAILERKSRV